MIKLSKNIILLLTTLLCSFLTFSQCDENVWNDSWMSCTVSSNPNTMRGESHWLLYEFDEPKRIDEIHIWNANKAGESTIGVKDATIDYSVDGSTWIELGNYEFPKANESDDYLGFDGPSLEGQAVRQILFTFQTNYASADNNCMSIAEVRFEVQEDPESTLVHIKKRNAPDFALDGDATEKNVYLWSANPDDINQQWLEIDRGNGYYSYQKYDTYLCLDGSEGGANGQDVTLNSCVDKDFNQHWLKVDVGEGAFKLIKRNASDFAVDGGNGGANGQNVSLYDASDDSQDMHWIVTLVDGSSKELDPELEDDIISIFPNPAVSKISFQGITSAWVNVYDLGGKVVLKQIISSADDTIDVSGLTTGIYIVTMQTETELIAKRLLKK